MYKIILALIALSTTTSAYATPNYEACTNAFHAGAVAWTELKEYDDTVADILHNIGKPRSSYVSTQYIAVIDKNLLATHNYLDSMTYLRDHFECLANSSDTLNKIVARIHQMENGITNLNYIRSILTVN